ncbi:hypothetical protein [Paractinoplanes hotanensis]|uniref:Fe-S cluster assembly protein HesB n=1 Tax=Paractinoplanes hotanensis TaxID=2906497 RepID=A0ABT0YCP2_9ACTN|nr:hypothetical protein [Actinoplanes hotanensis]MCM4083814.1 hypothetical protein [Actinoplanes hotanensis]
MSPQEEIVLFALSRGAVLAVRHLAAMRDAPPGASLRISPGSTAEALRLSLAGRPHPGDRVHDADEQLQVFVAEEAESLLKGRTLDARIDEAGQVQFSLLPPEQ